MIRDRSVSALPLVLCVVACAPAVRSPSPHAPVAAPATAAAHVVSRLTFGARPGDVAAVERMGVERWIDLQLHPERIPDKATDSVLALLETQRKRAFELLADNPPPEELAPRLRPRMHMDSIVGQPTEADSAQYRAAQRTAQALTAQIATARVIRATMSERQLLEVMTEFWANHFSVASGKTPNRYSLVEYERDVLRPNALGSFRQLLGAVARSPQMLFFLDQWQSLVDSMNPSGVEARIRERRAAMTTPPMNDPSLVDMMNRRRTTGVNENYARELLELHTLGANGGYTQADVVAVARALTGWTIDRPDLGGPFLFRGDQHDAGEKVVLGKRLAGGRGIEDGEQVLDILAAHPSTAQLIARKLVVRFVNDSPPAQLVERAAKSFQRTNGDIREVVRTIVTSPEFFADDAFRAKVKTPFEFVVSTLRALNAEPDTTPRRSQAVTRLGQPIWGRQSPDGWPDRADAWMNSGALLNRVNLASQVASGGVPGVAIAKWTPAPRLMNLSADQQVDGIISELLLGRASTTTRAAMIEAYASATESGRRPMDRLADVIGVALGSPEFQRR
ncbi:MAG TPA: DUF1800 domain-containing protein [Gemmatimonadaceae bacterium]|nr:DUF1800 domain-containing protein [Gemmatimonadaceae bacterium]